MKSIGPSQTYLKVTKVTESAAFFVTLPAWRSDRAARIFTKAEPFLPRIESTLAQVRANRTEAFGIAAGRSLIMTRLAN